MQIVFPISDDLLDGSRNDRKSGKKPHTGSRNSKLKSPKSDNNRKGEANSRGDKAQRGK